MSLVEITYYRNDDIDNIKTAIVKDTQVKDIKYSLPHIHITKISKAPNDVERDYILY